MSLIPATALFALLLSLLSQAPAFAQPMNLGNPQPRWVTASFEVSPAQRPGQLDTIYTQEFPAWFAPDDLEGRVKVTIDGGIVERYLLAEHRPVKGSFSDYVWIFDVASGHVTSATVVGRLVRTLDWGFFTSEVEASIRIQMATRSESGAPVAAGFAPPRSRFGQLLFHFCTIGDGEGCTPVSAAPYDPRSGYVNAVGPIVALSAGITTRAFSPLGEARFSEIGPADTPGAAPPGSSGAALEKPTFSPRVTTATPGRGPSDPGGS